MTSSDIRIHVMQESNYDQKHPQTNGKQVLLKNNIDLETHLKDGTKFNLVNGVLVYKDPVTGIDRALSTGLLANRSIGNVSNLTLESLLNMANIKWEDPKDTTIATSDDALTITSWIGTKVVMKEGSIPRDEKDGILILDSKVRNKYKTEGLEISDLLVGKTYHVKLFPYTSEGIVTNDDTNAVIINTTGSKLDAIADINFTPIGSTVFLRFTDPENKTGVYKGQSYSTAEYAGTKVVIKQGSAPTNHTDGTIVASYNTKNQHNTNSNILKFNVPSEELWHVTIFNYTTADVYSIGYSESTQINFISLDNVKSLSLTHKELDVTVKWQDPVNVTHFLETEHVVANWAGTKLVRKEGSEPVDENDGVLLIDSKTRDQYSILGYQDNALVEGKNYYYKLFPYTSEGKVTNSSANSSNIIPIILDDTSGAPGPRKLMGGDITRGYYGITTPAELISGQQLAEKIKLNAGISQNDSEGWLKFSVDGKIIYVAKKPFRHSISWGEISNAGAIKGFKMVTIGDSMYRIRLLKGLQDDKTEHTNIKNSEWNKLLLPIHIKTKDRSWDNASLIEEDVPYWGIDFTDEDLGFGTSTGRSSWCQESVSTDIEGRCIRGSSTVTGSGWYYNYARTSDHGWRPVLEYVGPALVDKYASPGAHKTIARGDKEGYFGEIAPTSFIKGSELASKIGLTAGTAQHDDQGWLKFMIDDKIVFVAKKPFRHTLSWDNVNATGAALGTKTININGLTYKVRLMGGIAKPGTPFTNTRGSEWNRLLLPVHVGAAKQSWAYPDLAETIVPDWGVGFDNSSLLTHYDFGSGALSLCMEWTDLGTAYRSNRGWSGVSHAANNPSSAVSPMGWRPVLELVPPHSIEDKTTTPGPKLTVGQTETEGYFGEVKSTDLIDGTTLASKVGITTGTSMNNDEGWLKFIIDNKIVFVAKKPFRHSISWVSLNSAGAVDGSKNITIGNNVYKVRLMKGAKNNPALYNRVDKDAIGSEWNRLMLPIHKTAKNQSWADLNVAGRVSDWGIGYTDEDLFTNYTLGKGYYTWCQEVPSDDNSSRVVRGNPTVSGYVKSTATGDQAAYGWRPVLEYVGPVIKDTIGSPGPSIPVARGEKEGYFGEVSQENLISGADLSSQLNITQGQTQYTNNSWLKFGIDGKIIFVSKKPIRYGLKWLDIFTAGATHGARIIKINDLYYRVRLIKGLLNANSVPSDTKGSEWNRLMLPINIKAKDKSWVSPELVESDLPYWGINFTDADLATALNASEGYYTLCQETISYDSTHRVVRGGYDASGTNATPTTNYDSYCGWRPVLELIGSSIEDTSGSPGASRTIVRAEKEGYFGEVTATQLISGPELSAQVGFTAGTSINDGEGWLKFAIDGKIVFVPKKPFRCNISWNQLDNLKLVDGSTSVNINGLTYKVRLIGGVNKEGTAASNSVGSEWNRLMLPVYRGAYNYGTSFDANFSDDNLNTDYHYRNADGCFTLCREVVSNTNTARSVRGYFNASHSAYVDYAVTSTNYGWRPVLELVQ